MTARIRGPVAVDVIATPSAAGHPLVDGCGMVATVVDQRGLVVDVLHFGGLALRCPGSDTAVCVMLRGRGVPNPRRWRPRMLWTRLVRWPAHTVLHRRLVEAIASEE